MELLTVPRRLKSKPQKTYGMTAEDATISTDKNSISGVTTKDAKNAKEEEPHSSPFALFRAFRSFLTSDLRW